MLLVLVGAIAWFAVELKATAGERAALLFAFPTLMLTDIWRIFQITAHALPTALIFGGAALVARRARTSGSLIITCALLGSLFNYVDFLVNPPWQPMLLSFVIVAAGRRSSEALKAMAAWGLGYAVTWASKWAIAVMFGVPWQDIFEVIKYRLHGDFESISPYVLVPSLKVLPFLSREVAWQAPAFVLLVILWPRLRAGAPDAREFVRLAWPALIPFAWFEILSNHTQSHLWFTYRPVASSIGICLAAWAIAADKRFSL